MAIQTELKARSPNAKSLSNRQLRVAYVSIVLALSVVLAISYHTAIAFDRSTQWVRHTHQILETLQDLRFDLGIIETSYRDFALTGDEAALDSYRASLPSLMRNEAVVRQLTADNPVQQHQLRILERLTAETIQLSEMVIDLRRSKGLEAAADAVRRGSGGRVRDEFQGAVREMRSEELRLLVSRNDDVVRLSRQSTVTLTLSAVIGVLIIAAIGWRTQHENARRGRAEEALRDSEEQYRMLLYGVRDYAIFMLDPQGRIVTWNAESERIYVCEGEDIYGQSFARFLSTEDIEYGKLNETLRLIAASGRHEGKNLHVRKDGSQFVASAVYTASRDTAGNLRGFSVISRDLSESKESAARFRGLLEAAPDAMVVVNQDDEIVLVNRQAERQFAYHSDELVGQKVQSIIPQGFAERPLAIGRRSAAGALTQQIGMRIELSGRRKDGSEFPIEIMLSPLENAGGILVTAAIRDITDRRMIERQLAQAQKMEELGNLTGGMAHDFNNGLGVIIGNLDLLGRLVKTDHTAAELCDDARDGALRCADLIRRLLAFARRQPLCPQQTDVNTVVANIATLLSRTLGEDIVLSLDTGTNMRPIVVDPAQLEAALTNLANNARDAMPRGGRLEIVTKAVELDAHYAALRDDASPGAHVLIEVSDTGTGISPDVIGRIFEPFFTTKPPGEGSGLGLSMAFGFAKQSGGHISVYSAPGHGSTFRIYLPYAYAGEARDAPPTDAQPALGGNETVLVVEDNAPLRRVAERQLTELGYQVREAEHAAAALEILRGDDWVDLLFTDVMMPGTMNGLNLAHRATQLRPGIKVLLASGFPGVRSGYHRMANNPFPLLQKPYHRDELARAIRGVFDKREEHTAAATIDPTAGANEIVNDHTRVVWLERV